MTSKLSLVNQALVILGAKRLTSLTDNTPHAQLANEIVDDVIREVMVDGCFSSTIKREALNATVNTPTYEYNYEFQLPTNPKCLRVLEVNENSTLTTIGKHGNIDYRIEGDKLLSDESTTSVRYVAYITDVGSYDANLNMAIKAKLSAEMAHAITGSASLADRLHSKYERVLAKAKNIDGQNGSPRTIWSDTLIDIR